MRNKRKTAECRPPPIHVYASAQGKHPTLFLRRQDFESKPGYPASPFLVGQLILATKSHDASLHADAPLLVNVDLSILGQAAGRFWKYEEQIRMDYEWAPEIIFATKRAEMLVRFLARKRI